MSFRPVTVAHEKKREKVPASTIPWSKYQIAVREEIATGSGHLCIKAFAGSAKSTTIVGALEVVPPGKSVLVAAFNKDIKDELKAKVPDGIEVSTLHSYGLRQLKRAFPELRAKGDAAVDDWKTKNLLREVLPEAFPYFSDTTKSSLCDAVRLAKDTLLGFGNAEAMDALLDEFQIEYGDDSRWNKILGVEVSMDPQAERNEFILMALKLLDESRVRTDTVDFSDMCWLPVVRKINCWQFDYLFGDEVQDWSAVQIELMIRACKPNGRIIAVGDENQALYSWRGADSNSIPNLIKRLKAKVLPLPICYRCATSIVTAAQEFVPAFQAQEGKEAGTVTRLSGTVRLMQEVQPGDFILSRVNAPLLPLCFALLRAGKPATIQGRDVAASLALLVKKAQRKGVKTTTELEEWLAVWEKSESEKLTKAGKDPQLIVDRAACVRVFTEECGHITEVFSKIERIFSREENPAFPNHNKIVLSTVHRAKGKERDRVWVLADTLRRTSVEEKNIAYVAYTRAKRDLFLIYRAKEES